MVVNYKTKNKKQKKSKAFLSTCHKELVALDSNLLRRSLLNIITIHTTHTTQADTKSQETK